MDPFTLLSGKLGIPIAKFLLKNWLNESASVGGGGLMEIAASKITDNIAKKEAQRQFDGLGDRICERLMPLFESEGRRKGVSVEAVAHELGITLEGRISAEFFLTRDLDPVELEAALRQARPLPKGQYSSDETALYDR